VDKIINKKINLISKSKVFRYKKELSKLFTVKQHFNFKEIIDSNIIFVECKGNKTNFENIYIDLDIPISINDILSLKFNDNLIFLVTCWGANPQVSRIMNDEFYSINLAFLLSNCKTVISSLRPTVREINKMFFLPFIPMLQDKNKSKFIKNTYCQFYNNIDREKYLINSYTIGSYVVYGDWR